MKASTFAIFLTFAVILAAASAQEEAQEVSDIENELLGELDTDSDTDTTDATDLEVQGCSRGWQSASFGFISNAHNLPGTPVRNKSLRQCIDVCKANASCKAFSYEKGKSKSNCWLKKALTHSGNKLYSTQRWYTYIVRCNKRKAARKAARRARQADRKTRRAARKARRTRKAHAKPKPKTGSPKGFKCNKKKRFVPGAGYSQWSSYTNQGGEAGRAMCRAHFKNGASAPNGWWYQYYSNGHFNCAKFNSAVTVSESRWENTHGRPEEVCVPSAPAIDVTQRLAAHTAVSAGKMKATKAATKASQCASDETFFWCQNNGMSTDKYDYCGDNSKCPVNGVHRNRCCYCGGCLKAV